MNPTVNRETKLTATPALRVAALCTLACLGLSGCETASSAWKGTTSTIGGWFESDAPTEDEALSPDAASAEAKAPPAAPPAAPSGGLATGTMPGATGGGGAFRSSARAPDLAAVPNKAPTPPSTEAERKEAVEGLVGDRERAQYTEQGGRREPVTVRPLSSGGAVAAASPPASTSPASTPPASTSEPVPPRTTALAERLGAAPPPPPPDTSGATAPAAAPAQPKALRATTPAPSAPAPPSTPAALVAAPRPSADTYGDETMVIDGSGVRGGDNRQLATAAAPARAAAPRVAFDPGNASVSSQIGTISFAPGTAKLSASAKTVLADVAQLRTNVDGAVRIEVNGDARAQAITAELKRLGVPTNRLYAGGGTGNGEEADIYLDY